MYAWVQLVGLWLLKVLVWTRVCTAAAVMDYNLYCGLKSNRLLIISDRAPEFTTAVKNTMPGVFVVRYNYDTSSLDDIICTYVLPRYKQTNSTNIFFRRKFYGRRFYFFFLLFKWLFSVLLHFSKLSIKTYFFTLKREIFGREDY